MNLPLDALQSVRELRHLPTFPEDMPMPLSPSQLGVLRGILHALESPRGLSDQAKREHVDALKRCIAELEGGDPQSPVWWAAGALHRSMRKSPGGIYIVTDRALQTWALDRIFDLFPEEH